MKSLQKLLIALSTFFFLLISLNKASIIDGSPDQIAIKIAAFSSKLDQMDFESLKTAALKLEAYSNRKKGGLILGGLHDYIGTMKKEEFKNFCVKIALHNPELLEEDKLTAVLNSDSSKENAHARNSKNAKKNRSNEKENEKKNISNESNSSKNENNKNNNNNNNNDSRSIYHDIHEKHEKENLSKFLEEPERLKPLKLGGLHDYIFKKDRKTLIKWAITAEAHYFVALKAKDEEPCGQWIYRKISKMSNEDLIKFILNMARKFPELDSATALNSLAEIYGINAEIVNFVSDPNNFQDSENSDSSKNENNENYKIFHENNKINENENIKINENSEQENITLVHDIKNHKNPSHHESHYENDSNNFHENHFHSEFDKNQKHEKHSHPHRHHAHPSANEAGNLHDYISSGERETLIKWALTAEAHSHHKLEKKPIGGLHDFITSLSNEEIGKYITIAAKRMPELNSKENMDKLALEYGVSDETVRELAKVVVRKNYENENENDNSEINYNDKENDSNYQENQNTNNNNSKHSVHSGHCEEHNDSLNNCIHNHDRKSLVKWALVAEAVLNANNPNASKILGGLHDHIHSLSNEELGKYVTVAAKNHPELNNKENMEKLAEQYGIHPEKYSTRKENEKAEIEKKFNKNENGDNKNSESLENLNTRLDLFFSELMAEDRKDLISWAFAAEKYDREKHGFHQLEGGLEDYIWKLDKDAIVDYIAGKAITYPELKDKSYLEFLSRRYGFKKD